MKALILLTIPVIIFLCGCQHEEHQDTGHQHSSVSVTKWTDKLEVFMEYEMATIGHDVKFIIHLTRLSDFQPVREGKVILSFRKGTNTDIRLEEDHLLREGIYTPVHVFKSAGDYEFTMEYHGPSLNETFNWGTFTVFSSHDFPHTEHEEHQHKEISFLKEQQWKMDFSTEEAFVRQMKSSVDAFGEVKSSPASSAEIVSPVEGIIATGSKSTLVKPGQNVVKGQALASLLPPLTTQNSWVEVYKRYERAKTEYNRANRLKKRKAISARAYEEARREYDMQKASFSSYFDSDQGNIRFDSTMQQFRITAPMNGTINNIYIKPGQNVEYGQALFSLINSRSVWLEIKFFPSQLASLKEISGLSLRIPGKDPITIRKEDLSEISRGKVIDSQARTVPLWLEVNNTEHNLYIGQTFSTSVYTSPSGDMLAIPRSALYEDEGKVVAYVHASGEIFEERELETGSEYNNYVAILNGVTEGERVVTRGGYQIRTASDSESIGHPHTH